MTALPAIFAACLVLAIAYVVGRVVSGLVASLLASAGFDTVLVRLGIGNEPAEGKRTPSQTVGYLVLVALILFASIEALRLLGFESLAGLVTQFTAFAGQVILGLIIFGLGLYISNLAATAVRASRAAQARLLALAARAAILVLAGAMALRQMGLANEIINLAFGLLLGARGLGLIEAELENGFINLIAEVTLFLLLASDGSRIDLAILKVISMVPVGLARCG